MYSPRRMLESNKTISERLHIPESANAIGQFGRWQMKISDAPKIMESFGGMGPRGDKKLEKQYLLKGLVKLLAADNISSDDSEILQNIIKHSSSFKKNSKNVDDITIEDIYKLYNEVQSSLEFIQQATVEELMEVQAQIIADGEALLSSSDLSVHDKLKMYEKLIILCSKTQNIFSLADYSYALSTLLGQLVDSCKPDDIATVIQYHQEFLKSKCIDEEQLRSALNQLITICKERDDIPNLIKCYKAALGVRRMASEALQQLVELYENQGDIDNAAEFYELEIKLNGVSSSTCGALIKFCIKHKEITKAIEYYQKYYKEIESNDLNKLSWQLIEIYKTQNDAEGLIKFYKLLLGVDGWEESALQDLVEHYEGQDDIDNAISVHELAIQLNGVSVDRLKSLALFCIKHGKIEKAIPCYKKYILIPGLNLDYPDNLGFSQEVLSLFDAQPNDKALKILRILGNVPELWQGDNKLTLNQWTLLLNTERTIPQLTFWRDRKHISVSDGINKDLWLDDPTMPEWNVLIQPEGVIDDENWDILKTVAYDIFDSVQAGDENKKLYLAKFFDQCMGAADANNETGKQNIRKRVAACINYLNELKVKFEESNDEAEKELLAKQIKGGLDIIAVGGAACADRAIVFLTNLENYIKLLKNPQYLPNLMVLMYKLEVIKDYLTDPTMSENIETYLYYCLNLNEILGLGLPAGGKMLYEGVAVKMPRQQALEKLSPGFNIEGLIHFTTMNETFKSMYEKEREQDPAVMEAVDNYIDAEDDLERAKLPRAQKTPEEIAELDSLYQQAFATVERVRDDFYKEKARALFQEAGFLI